MATHRLDEIESDEIYHALVERQSMLNKRIKDLDEKDGLPEAAQAVRDRLALYNPNGDGKSARPGLIRQFAPQGHLDTEARNAREERDPDGQQDAFGGGVETGGAPRKGGKKRSKKKGEGDASDTPDAGEPVEAEYEIIPDGRRLGSGPTLTDAEGEALDRLETIAGGLEAGVATIEPSEFDAEAGRLLELMRAVSAIAPGYVASVATRLANEYRDADENAHNLARVIREVLTDLRPGASSPADETPVGGAPDDAGVLSFAAPGTSERHAAAGYDDAAARSGEE